MHAREPSSWAATEVVVETAAAEEEGVDRGNREGSAQHATRATSTQTTLTDESIGGGMSLFVIQSHRRRRW